MIDYEARGAVAGVPPIYLATLQSVAFNKGIPISWLAAVCEMTGWNPDYRPMNYYAGGESVRQLGLAGIWWDVPEITFGCPCPAGIVAKDAGWFGDYIEGFGRHFRGYNPCGYGSYNIGLQQYPSVLANLNLAADILKATAGRLRATCGALNAHLFLMWQWGCLYAPRADQCATLPANVPGVFKDEVDSLIEAQRLYAQQFEEPPIIPGPLSVALSASPTTAPPGQAVSFQATPTGGAAPYQYTWNFGDGQQATTSGGSTTHAYAAEGTYNAAVQVADSRGDTALSLAVTIVVSVTAPPPGGIGSGWLLGGLIGLVGLGGLVGLARRKTPEGKRQQAAGLRAEASRLRGEAASLRAQGKHAEAQRLELQASDLEQRATELERQAQQEETARLYQQGQPSGSQKIARY